MFETVSHDALLVGFHVPSEITLTVAFSPPKAGFHALLDNVRDAVGVTVALADCPAAPLTVAARTRSVTACPFGRFVNVCERMLAPPALVQVTPLLRLT